MILRYHYSCWNLFKITNFHVAILFSQDKSESRLLKIEKEKEKGKQKCLSHTILLKWESQKIK